MSETLRLEIEFETSVHHGSGFGIGGLVDRAVLRNSLGEYVLSASSIKGKFRHAALQVMRAVRFEGEPPLCGPGAAPCHEPACLWCIAFGSARRRGSILFEDALIAGPEREWIDAVRKPGGDSPLPVESSVRARTAVDRKRRVARARHLYTTEAAPALSFVGNIYLIGPGDAGKRLLLLRHAARLLTTFGGDSARGLGHCRCTVSEAVENQ